MICAGIVKLVAYCFLKVLSSNRVFHLDAFLIPKYHSKEFGQILFHRKLPSFQKLYQFCRYWHCGILEEVVIVMEEYLLFTR
jgi:hypothetical protein